MSKFKVSNLLYGWFFFLITIFGSVSILFDVGIENYNGLVLLTFLINGIIILWELSKTSTLGYSLKEMFFLFMFIFMFFSPLVQYLSYEFPWGDTYLITDNKIIYSNFIITTFMAIYIIVHKITENNIKQRGNLKSRTVKNLKSTMDFFFVVTIICSLFLIINTGFSNLFARSTNSLEVASSSFALIATNTFRSIPVIYVAMNLLYREKKHQIYKRIPFSAGVLLMIIVNFPTATARFWMASVYLGILLILIKKFKNPYLFKIIIFIGILIIFPAINSFRINTFDEALQKGINIPNPAEAFLAGDFDSFSMLVRATIFTDFFDITWGYQLLGNLLFFIPRKIWPLKPIGSGAMIGTSFGWDFKNVSMPYIGEGYINFGILGVILFGFILAVLTARGDELYANCVNSKNKITFIEIVYPFSIGFLFFILRGDLLSSLSYYIGFLFPILFLMLIQKFAFNKKPIK